MIERPIQWIGDSYEALCAFPVAARRDAGFQLDSVQHGLAPFDWKPMSIIGGGVQEIRIDKGGSYRVIYIAKFEEAVYVLHAFQKKTRRTLKKDIDLAKQRFRDVQRLRSNK